MEESEKDIIGYHVRISNELELGDDCSERL